MLLSYRHVLRRLTAATVLILLAITSSDAFSSGADTIIFTQPDTQNTVIPALDDFATTVMGDPWDMNEPTDLWAYRDTSYMVNSSFADGMFEATMTDKAGSVMLLTAGAANNAAMRIGKTGYTYPINADKYRYLSYRFYKSNDNCNSSLVMWYADDSRTPAVTGASNSYAACETPGPGWHTKVVDLATIGIQAGEREWTGTIRELILKPFNGPGSDGATFKLDWVRLTSEDPRAARPITLRWDGGDNSDLDLYASEDQKLDGSDILIARGVDGSEGSYTVNGGKLFPGSFYVAAVDDDGVSWSPGRIIVNLPPQITFLSPSMLSGQDYAATELGNAWDMNEASDLNDSIPTWWETCIGNQRLSNSIFTADLIGCSNDTFFTDAKLLLGHMDPPGNRDPVIDTSKYRYFSFRFFLNGQQNIREGWVARFGWWQSLNGGITKDPVLSRDIMLKEGWNTYKVDLWAPDVVDENHDEQRPWLNSAPNRIRFDPAELYTKYLPEEFSLDWIKLTAMDEVERGAPFLIRYETDTVRPATVAFYYDDDTNPGNGRKSITTADVAAPAAAADVANLQRSVYLPMFANGSFSCDECVQWTTENVTPGQYYVCADIDDGYNSTYRCSESPVLVR